MAGFIKIKCAKCNNEQVAFANASTVVKCLICGAELVAPTGGKSNVAAEVLEQL